TWAQCGRRLPKETRYCPECGQPVGDPETKVQELPPDETGPVPVTVTHGERRYYGVAPTALALGLAVTAVVAAIALFATGHWPIALVVLGVGLLLLLVSVETRVFRDPAGVAAHSFATRGPATTRPPPLRHARPRDDAPARIAPRAATSRDRAQAPCLRARSCGVPRRRAGDNGCAPTPHGARRGVASAGVRDAGSDRARARPHPRSQPRGAPDGDRRAPRRADGG